MKQQVSQRTSSFCNLNDIPSFETFPFSIFFNCVGDNAVCLKSLILESLESTALPFQGYFYPISHAVCFAKNSWSPLSNNNDFMPEIFFF